MDQAVLNQLYGMIHDLGIIAEEFRKPREPSRLEIAARMLAAQISSSQFGGDAHLAVGNALNLADALIAAHNGTSGGEG